MGNSSSNLEGKCENWPLIETGSLILCNSYKEEEDKLCRWNCRYRGGGDKIVRQMAPIPSMKCEMKTRSTSRRLNREERKQSS